MAEKKQDDMPQVQRPQRGEPDGPGDPVEGVALSQMGATFAERAAAAKKASKKAVPSRDAENKAVGSSESKASKK